MKAGTHSALLKGSHTRVYTAKHGHILAVIWWVASLLSSRSPKGKHSIAHRTARANLATFARCGYHSRCFAHVCVLSCGVSKRAAKSVFNEAIIRSEEWGKLTILVCDNALLRVVSGWNRRSPTGLRSIIVKSLTFLLLHKTVVANRFAPWYHEIGKY